jgi:dTDP-4-dehydrorhamnose 3,5-epimerase
VITNHLLPISGAQLFKTKLAVDTRGCFEVSWERELLNHLNIEFEPNNAYHSYNSLAGTLRGLHFQKPPHAQAKLVSCVQGRAWDVMVDLRKDSATFGKWHATELCGQSGVSVLVPAGCAHGFVTLQDNTTIAYLISGNYHPTAGRVLRWNDRHIQINWPIETPILSAKDADAPELNSCDF